MPHTEEQRKSWLRALALATGEELSAAWALVDEAPSFEVLKGPEVGLAMARGRTGGTGAAFNVGEVSVTRCVVSATDQSTGSNLHGVGFVTGRDTERALLVARLDALFQDSAQGAKARAAVLAHLDNALAERRATQAARTAATRVDFFTMQRGE